MIPILYEKDEMNFTSNGICRLPDIVSGFVTEERNGIYECEFVYPITGKNFSEISEGRVIACFHDDTKTIQPFDIYGRSAPIDGMVTFYAHHISYRLGRNVLYPFRATSCQQLFANLQRQSMNECPFTFWTDKNVSGEFNLDVPKSIKEIFAGYEGSVLDVYGKGEFEWDKYTVRFKTNRGSDNGVTIRYGKNLTKLTRDLDASDVYNAVAPFWKSTEYVSDGDSSHEETIVVTLPEGYITASSISGNTIEDYDDYVEIVPLDLSSEFEEEPTVAALRAKAREKLDGSDAWVINENISVDFVHLWEGSDNSYAALQRVSLCDKVDVIDTRVNLIKIKMEVIKVVYDFVQEKYTSMELGTPKQTYSESLVDTITTMTETILDDIPTKSFFDAAIEHATDLITGGLGGHLVIKTNSQGQPEELLIMDTDDINTAVKVWRFNMGGLGFSSNGYEGPFELAITMDGSIVADFITTGILNAGLIRAGILMDQQGNNWWNLESGELHISNTDLNVDVGGTNLVLGTKEMLNEGDARWVLGPSNGESYINNGVAYLKGKDPDWYIGSLTGKKIGDYINRTITFSFDFFATSTENLKLTVYLALNTNITSSSPNNIGYKKIVVPTSDIVLGKKNRIVVQFLPTGADYFYFYSGKSYSPDLYFSFRIFGEVTESFVQVSREKAEVGTIPTDWSPAPEDYDTEVQAVDQKYSNLSVTIDGISTEVGHIQQDVTGLEQDYSSMQQTIGGIQTTVGHLQNDIDGLEQDYSQITQTVDGISTEVLSMKRIGATNLILGSKRMNNLGESRWSVYPNTSSIDSGIAILSGNPCRVTGATGKKIGQFMEESITLSFDAYISKSADKKDIDVYLLLNEGPYDLTNSYGYKKITLSKDRLAVGRKRRLTAEFKLPNAEAFTFYSGKSYNDNLYISFRIQGVTASANLQISRIKAEKGGVSSDWSPAPEDTDEEFAEVDTKYSTITQTVDGISTEVVSIHQDISGIEQQYSTISQSVDEINLEVGQMKSIGGANLLLGTEDMVTEGDSTWGVSPSSCVISSGIASLKPPTDGTLTTCYIGGITGKKIGSYMGKAITVSFDAYIKTSADKKNLTVSILLNTGKKTLTRSYAYKDLVISSDKLAVKKTKRVSVEFDILNSSYFTYASGASYSDDLYIAIRITGNVTNELRISKIKAEVGPVATDWTPASDDKVGTNEIISRINMTPEQIAIEANKISLAGKTIDLSTDNINILSTNGDGQTKIYYDPDYIAVDGLRPILFGGQRGWIKLGYTSSGVVNIEVGNSHITVTEHGVSIGYERNGNTGYGISIDSSGIFFTHNGDVIDSW